MYERFYHLRERPFALSPDPDYLYPSRVHQEALDYLRYGLESHAGFVVVTGEIGSGKTTLLQTVLRTLDAHTTVARIVNTILDPREVLEALLVDLGLDPSGKSKPLMLRDLAQFLVDQRMHGRMVLVVIDEAQNLSAAALEELRMLSNLETEKSKLMQIVLIGQPNLRDKLNSPQLEQLRQRITVSYHLQPLDADDAARYISHRLRHAAIGAPPEFPRAVTDLVHARSHGVPRIINVICDAVLVFGYAEERHHIDRALTEEALKELEATGVLPAEPAAEACSESVDMASSAGAPVVVAPAYAGSLNGSDAGFGEAPPAYARPAESAPASFGGTSSPASVAHPAPASSTAGAALAIATREEEIRRREEMLLQRERELQEQRRVLSEEYRLLRRTGATPTSAPADTQGFGAATPAYAHEPAATHGYVPPRRVSEPLGSVATGAAAPHSAGRPLTQRATTPAPAYSGMTGYAQRSQGRESFWSRIRRLFARLAEV
ncbi:MAG TPA: XrtA/PEP-CTERM system-associated ATPase [Vicinamibacterales bacterium]|nr:XrtA/PEP-CTERM system-associated ATPase [Vicinamibacterales bacterium]